jgi:hypothetical protein
MISVKFQAAVPVQDQNPKENKENFQILNQEGKILDNVLDVSFLHQDDFYPFSKIFIRDCYTSIGIRINEILKNGRCGDPGIGKTTLLRRVLMNRDHNKKSIFWTIDSGNWVCFNHLTGILYSISESNMIEDLWTDKKTILLINGSFKNKFLSKIKNFVLFC